LQLAIYLHAARALPYLRSEASGAGKVSFVFRDDASRGQQLQLEYNRGAVVPARDLFASQTFIRQQMSSALENSTTTSGEPSHEYQSHPHR
jgi:hypothetical protein